MMPGGLANPHILGAATCPGASKPEPYPREARVGLGWSGKREQQLTAITPLATLALPPAAGGLDRLTDGVSGIMHLALSGG